MSAGESRRIRLPSPVSRVPALGLTVCLLGLAGLLALAVGGVSLDWTELVARSDLGEKARLIAALRLPRVALAALVGACLALAGAAMQALLQHPLAHPFFFATSGGAATGAPPAP